MPMAASSSRMRSDSAKFLALRAALRAAIRHLDLFLGERRLRRIVGLPRLQLAGPEAEKAQRARQRPAAGGVLQAVHLGDRLRRVQIVEQRIEHARRRPRIGLGGSRIEKARQRLLGFLQPLHRPVDRLAVVGAQHRKPHHVARPVRQHLADGDEIAEALAHLLAFDLQEAVVHPEIRHHGCVERAARLRDLVLVVREHEIDAAAVDVEGLAEMLPRHRRAFDVPARPARRPDAGGDGHAGSPRLRRLPQHEIHRVALVGRDVDARARDHLVERTLGELAVVLHRRHAEQHVLVGHVGVVRGDQPLDQRLHLLDVLGRARLDVRRQAAERRDVLLEIPVGLFGQVADGDAALGRTRVDLVVDVGDVADVSDVRLAVEMAQQPVQHVEHDHRPRIADMGEVVDRRPAHIHAHVARIERRKRPLLARQRIVELQFHRSDSSLGLLAGRLSGLDWRKDGRSQR